MGNFQSAVVYLPLALRAVVQQVPESVQAITQEIRLRIDAPVTLSTPRGEILITKSGDVTELSRLGLLICDAAQVNECFQMLCEYSVHTHQQEIREGYISTKNGCRAGIAGSMVVENGRILSVRQITSVCIRVAREHDGCADELFRILTEGNRIQSALICGEPSSGKSSLLRDLANQLSSGVRGRRYRTVVVDERGELSGVHRMVNCDVLLNCPKAQGIQQAVRCLAPDVVIFDELGTVEETVAVCEGLNAGVAAIASAHGRDRESLIRRPQIAAALEAGAFERVVLLAGRESPGRIAQIMEAGECFAKNHRIDTYNRSGGLPGAVCVDGIKPACRYP